MPIAGQAIGSLQSFAWTSLESAAKPTATTAASIDTAMAPASNLFKFMMILQE
jgi:hypothetical protein